jgi:hypothetical protein
MRKKPPIYVYRQMILPRVRYIPEMIMVTC